MFVVILVVWIGVIFYPNRKPELLSELSGCYLGPETLKDRDITISTEGRLDLGDRSTTTVETEEVKSGLAFVPRRRVTFTTAVETEVVIDSGHPMFLLISTDRQSFNVPGNGEGATFNKVPC